MKKIERSTKENHLQRCFLAFCFLFTFSLSLGEEVLCGTKPEFVHFFGFLNFHWTFLYKSNSGRKRKKKKKKRKKKNKKRATRITWETTLFLFVFAALVSKYICFHRLLCFFVIALLVRLEKKKKKKKKKKSFSLQRNVQYTTKTTSQ
jgi:uncharacterized membrane protein